MNSTRVCKYICCTKVTKHGAGHGQVDNKSFGAIWYCEKQKELVDYPFQKIVLVYLL